MADVTLDLNSATLFVYDPAGKQLLGYTNSFSSNFLLFVSKEKAMNAADRLLKSSAYPLATVSFTANRKAFKLQPGDLFKFTYAPWQVSNMVCRVISIQEKELGSEDLIITALEDIDYISGTFTTSSITMASSQVDSTPPPLTGKIVNYKVVEAPYALCSGGINNSTGEITIHASFIPMASKVTGLETGYYVYESVDGGISYTSIGRSRFNFFGRLAENYPVTSLTIDDSRGILVQFNIFEVLSINDISRSNLFNTINLAMIGDEFITFQTISLVSGNTYRLMGVNRALYGSQKEEHGVGTSFYFIGDGFRSAFIFRDDPTGSTRMYKFVPYSETFIGSIDIADNPITYTYVGIAY